MRIALLASTLALTCALPSCLAQYTVKNLVFRGAGRYSQQQLEEAVALPPGTHFGTKEMGDAAQRLMDSGAFQDVSASVEGPVSSISVIFNLKTSDLATFEPVLFENFVWFSSSERDAELHKRVPLYLGRVPEAGTLQTAVTAALVAMLKAKGVDATVEGSPVLNEGSATPVVVYRVTSPRVVLDGVKLAGVDAAMAAAERAALQPLAGQPYRVGSDTELDDRLLLPYRNAGYIDARIANLQLTPQPAADGVVKVTLSGKVEPGEVYHVGSIQWTGSPVYSAEEFNKNNPLHPGDAASLSALQASYTPMLNSYLSRGYQDVDINPQPVRDTAAHTISYTLKVKPGEVYHVSNVTVAGLDVRAKQDFEANFKMKSGAVYDPAYAKSFLTNNSAIKSLLPYTGSFQAVAHPETHTVDLTMTFFAQGAH